MSQEYQRRGVSQVEMSLDLIKYAEQRTGGLQGLTDVINAVG